MDNKTELISWDASIFLFYRGGEFAQPNAATDPKLMRKMRYPKAVAVIYNVCVADSTIGPLSFRRYRRKSLFEITQNQPFVQ